MENWYSPRESYLTISPMISCRWSAGNQVKSIFGGSLSHKVMLGHIFLQAHRSFRYVLWLLALFSWDPCMCKHECLCFHKCFFCAFTLVPFLLYIFLLLWLIWFSLSYCFYSFSLDTCLFPKEIQKEYVCKYRESGSREDIGQAERGENCYQNILYEKYIFKIK